MMSGPVPAQLRGLWRRLSLTAPNVNDTTTRVLWLQTASLFADIRIPADRLDLSSAAGFAAVSDDGLIALAAMAGFAGVLEVEGDICRWRRELDFQPPGGPPDEGRFRLEGDLLIETGIHADYEEVWRRETPAAPGLAAFRLVAGAEPADPAGILTLAGDYFLMIRARRNSLPPAPALADLVRSDLASGDRQGAISKLAMPIAFGRVSAGMVVTLSTEPWREGAPLFAGCTRAFDSDRLTLRVAGPDGIQEWRLDHSTIELNALAHLLETLP
jgi:hypothetical protein